MIVAQLSDLHLRQDNDRLKLLEQALDWLRPVRPDAIVFTGDIVEQAWVAGYAQVKARLEAIGCPWFAVAGNVDRQAAMREGLGLGGERPVHFDATVAGVRLIGLDVTVAGAAHGDVAPHIEWLKPRLGEAPWALFMHQHLVPIGNTVRDGHGCHNGEVLERALRAGARMPALISGGHVHRATAGVFAGVPAYTCPSLRPANVVMIEDRPEAVTSDAPGLMLHRIAANGTVSHFVSL